MFDLKMPRYRSNYPWNAGKHLDANEIPHWFCDGTFDSAPIGYQLYTILVLLNETVTIVFCIAKDKTEVTYNKIFSTPKEHNPLLNPALIMIDYERAALNALTQNFPNTEIQGCFFFFTLDSQYGGTSKPTDCNNGTKIMKNLR